MYIYIYISFIYLYIYIYIYILMPPLLEPLHRTRESHRRLNLMCVYISIYIYINVYQKRNSCTYIHTHWLFTRSIHIRNSKSIGVFLCIDSMHAQQPFAVEVPLSIVSKCRLRFLFHCVSLPICRLQLRPPLITKC